MGNTLKVKRGTNLSNAGTPAAGELIYKTDTNQLFVGDGSTAATSLTAIGGSGATGDIEGVTAGVGLSGGGSSGTVSLAVDLSELTDMTASVNSSEDELIILDNGADRRKLISEIPLSAFNNDSGFITATLTTEAVQDIVGAMFTSNTETRGSLTYDDSDGTIDLVVDDMTANDNTFRTVTAGGNTLGATETLAFTAGSNITISESGGAVTIASTDTNTQLSTEQVQDIVGAMFDSNTETRISATYQDGDGTIDLVVDDMTANDNTVTTNIAGTGVSVSSGTGNSTISTNDSEIVHDNLSGFVANEHIDHTSVTLTAGAGLTGGGTIAANRTFAVGAGTGVTVNANDVAINFKDEDDMSSNSASHAATQQSIKAYVDAEVAGIVNSAPSALNTLDELAAALGDDANFATTTSTSLGNRLRVDTASQGLTGTQQANAITNLGITATKAELNYVDGVTSNIQTQLDALPDTAGTNITLSGTTLNVDDAFLINSGNDTTSGTITAAGFTTSGTITVDDIHGNSNSNNRLVLDDDTKSGLSNGVSLTAMNTIYLCCDETNNGTGEIKFLKATDQDLDGGNVVELGKFNNSGNFTAAGSGTFASLDISGDIDVDGTANLDAIDVDGAANLTGRVTITDGGADGLLINNDTGNSADSARIFFEGTSTSVIMQQGSDLSFRTGATTGSSSGTERFRVNSSGADINGNLTLSGTVDGRDIATDGSKLDGIESGATADQSASEILTAIKTVDGSGSGLDADTLDGSHASAFLTSVPNHSGDLITSGTVAAARIANLAASKITSGELDTARVNWDSTDKTVRWDNGRGYHGNPRSVAMGYSGGNYGQLGYNIEFTTTSNEHTYSFNDIATRVDLYDGILVYTSDTGGTAGSTISWTELLDCRGDVFQYKNTNIALLSNGSDNRIITASSATNLNGESNLTFDGSTLTLTGEFNPSSHIDMPDDARIKLGASDDLQIVHTSNINFIHSVISDRDIYFRVNDGGTDRDAIIIDASENALVKTYADLQAGGDVIAYASSDKRLKDNLKPIENSLDKVSKLSGYEFDWNDKQETYQGKDVGVVAQEVEEVMPEIVTTRDNGYKAVKYEKLVPLLIESIKELKAQIEELKK